MNLKEELDRLAEHAEAYTDVDQVLRLARRRRTGQAALVSAALVAAAVAVTVAVPRWSAHRAPVADAGTRTRLTLTVPDGTAPDRPQLGRTARVLADRALRAGVRGATVAVADERTIVLSVPGRPDQARLRRLAAPGTFTMRLVIGAVPGQPVAPAIADPGPATSLDEVKRKLGPAYEVAQSLWGPARLQDAVLAQLAPFAGLNPAEVAVLPPELQFNVPTVSCAQLDARPYRPADGRLTACATVGSGRVKYLLDAPSVTGADVARAEAGDDPAQGGPHVTVAFSPAGQARWTDLTRRAYDNGAEHQVAMLIDQTVVSAPAVKAVITGDGLIAGISRTDATDIAAVLTTGPLPVPLLVSAVDVTR